MAANTTTEVPCHLSDHAKRKLKQHLNDVAGGALPLGLRHDDNYIIPMNDQQRKKLEDAKASAGRVTVSIGFTQEQLQAARKLDRRVARTATKPPSSKLDSLSMKELADLYEQVCAAMKRKAEEEAQKFKEATSSTKRGPLITPLDIPCDVSYNEPLYCVSCKKRTDNESAKLSEHGKRHRVTAHCSQCQKEKSREVNMEMEIEDGRISFL